MVFEIWKIIPGESILVLSYLAVSILIDCRMSSVESLLTATHFFPEIIYSSMRYYKTVTNYRMMRLYEAVYPVMKCKAASLIFYGVKFLYQ